jgi:hypothetical protein
MCGGLAMHFGAEVLSKIRISSAPISQCFTPISGRIAALRGSTETNDATAEGATVAVSAQSIKTT